MPTCKCTFSQKMVGDGCKYCNPQLKADIDAEIEGAEAFHQGVPRTGCPYSAGRDEASWLIGWDDAYTEVQLA